MAAVSTAMLRPAGVGLDPPYYSSQRITYSPSEDSKSKKSWGQKLKLSPTSPSNQSQTSSTRSHPLPNMYGTVSGPGGSALSKSMKYAETWLYGTVRAPSSPSRPGLYFQYAEPSSPVLITTPQAPIQNYAVVVCSCSEYLNGTKKASTKKVSICKKCKGSRLPLSSVPMNGTVRGQIMGGTVRSMQPVRTSSGTLRVGTLQLTPTSKSRPTILSLSQTDTSDPYDLMRRTRLTTPLESAHVGSQFIASRSRAKSISPSRSRSRRKSPPTESIKTRSKSVSRGSDLWFDETMAYESDYGNRKSILECDVNPYDLVRKTKTEKHHSIPKGEEDFIEYENDETFSLKKLQENLQSKKHRSSPKHYSPYSNIQAISGQRIRIFEDTTTNSVEEGFVYDDAEIHPAKIQKSSELPKNSPRSIMVDSKTNDSKTVNNTNTPTKNDHKPNNAKSPKVRDVSPKRPPRRIKTDTSEEESESDRIKTKQCGMNNSSNQALSDTAIKSILKKPRGDKPSQETDHSSSSSTPSPRQTRKDSGTQFYIPTPQSDRLSSQNRKKVQFLDDNEASNPPSRKNSITFSPVVRIEEIPDVDIKLETSEKPPEVCNDVEEIVEEKTTKTTEVQSEEETSLMAGKGDIRITIIADETGLPDQIGKNDSDELSENNGKSVAIKPSSLRRSQSERLILNGSPESPSFLDTMALRQKHLRPNSKKVFFGSQSLVEIVNIDKPVRPRESPPPPPVSYESSNDKKTNSSVTILCTKENSDTPSTKESETKTLPAPPPPPRSRVRDIAAKNFSGKKEPNYVKTRFIRDRKILEEMSTVAIDQDDRPSIRSENASKGKVVHRLSITHDDSVIKEALDNNQRKTSIMISGDDCYSTVNVNNDTPIYQSSVTINDMSSPAAVTNTGNTVTISVYSENDDGIVETGSLHSNQIYIFNNARDKTDENESIPDLSPSNDTFSSPGKTLVVVDYETINNENDLSCSRDNYEDCDVQVDYKTVDSDKKEIVRPPKDDSKCEGENICELLKNPVEAVKRNLVPHVCGKVIDKPSTECDTSNETSLMKNDQETKILSRNSFISKLLEDPMLGHLAEGLETELVAKLIENSLVRLKQSRNNEEHKTNDEEETMNKLIDVSLHKLQKEISCTNNCQDDTLNSVGDSNNDEASTPSDVTENTVCPGNYESMEYENSQIGPSSDVDPLSDCYNASASELSTEEDNSTRSKFYQMLVDATLSEIEITNSLDDDHHYESIRLNADPIYEEIGDIPPPLPLNPPPASITSFDDDSKQTTRSIFEGASKYDILSYLVDAKERGIVPEDSYTFNFNSPNDMNCDEEAENAKESIEHQRQSSDLSSRVSNLSNGSDSSEDNSLIISSMDGEKSPVCKKSSTEIERNDSGVGSETSKCSRSRWQGHNIPPNSVLDNNTPIHLCEDCDSPVETQVTESGVMYAPLVCRKCGKKRAERKEIITEIVETEEKYGRDLQIILEEFYQPMLVAGLLTQEQLSAVFLNTEELLENNQALAERLRDALEIAIEQGDEDLLTVNIGKLILESSSMLHAFSSYCVRQGSASMLLSNLEKEKELLRIFLKVSQMENTVLRRMNLNSFLMVPVQRVTKYPLLLSRLYKVTPHHLEGRDLLRQSQQKIEQHLSHMNSEAKDVTSMKLWRRISNGASGRRSNSEIDMINIKLRKMAVDVLEWNHDEARFAIEGKLLFTQPNDNNWRKGRTIKLAPINALLVTNGKPTAAYKPHEGRVPCFPHNTGVREASLLLIREKGGRAALLREPLYLDRCVVAADSEWDDYFELQEIVSKDTYIFKAEDSNRTKQWCQQLQYHCQGMGAWRKRRNALANIMINGMFTRN